MPFRHSRGVTGGTRIPDLRNHSPALSPSELQPQWVRAGSNCQRSQGDRLYRPVRPTNIRITPNTPGLTAPARPHVVFRRHGGRSRDRHLDPRRHPRRPQEHQASLGRVRAPLAALHRWWAATAFNHSARPPRERGRTWSTVVAPDRPQYAHRPRSRCMTPALEYVARDEVAYLQPIFTYWTRRSTNGRWNGRTSPSGPPPG